MPPFLLQLGLGRCCRLQPLQLQDADEEQEGDAQEKQPEENPVVLWEEEPRPPQLHGGPFGPGEKATANTHHPGGESKSHPTPAGYEKGV